METNVKLVDDILRRVRSSPVFPSELLVDLRNRGYRDEEISWHYVQMLNAENAKIFLRADGKVAIDQARRRATDLEGAQ